MPSTIKIKLSPEYAPFTEKDVREAKDYVLRRERAADALEGRIDSMVADAAEQVASIALSYNIRPERLEFTQECDETMFREIAETMDALEGDIMDAVIEYSLACAEEDEDRRGILLAWVLALGKGGRGLEQTLHTRLYTLMRDIEAMVVACKIAGMPRTAALAFVKGHLKDVYTSDVMRRAFRMSAKVKSPYIRSMGAKHGNVGNSSSEAVNIDRFGRTTLQMAWMRNLWIDYTDDDVAAYYVLRGSNYDCALCDSYVGLHPADDWESFPPYHPHCCCYAVPVTLSETT